MRLLISFCSLFLVVSAFSRSEEGKWDWDSPHAANPILPGYFADPDYLSYQGKHYIYATLDPWGGDTLGCWESSDFKNWEYRSLNWPTKVDCTSEKSGGAMVWAPTVGRGYDGRFYMYVSVGSEIWVGVAEHPLGPWENALGDRPMIPFDWHPDYHMIDADLFEDEDGSRYLYWGSGWNWKNGRCYAAKLDESMTGFAGEPKVVTPANYFEAPVVFREGKHYYMLYSNGITIKDTYQIHYAVSKSPMGPFEEAKNSPLLVTDHERNVVSPGHNTVATVDGQWHLIYHRQGIPFVEGEANRQVCVDAFEIDKDGLIQFPEATHRGADLVRGRSEGSLNLVDEAVVSNGIATGLTEAADDNFATLWRPEIGGRATLEIDLRFPREVSKILVFPEFAWKPFPYLLEVSLDGESWQGVPPEKDSEIEKSPIRYHIEGIFRFARLRADESDSDNLGIWDLRIYPQED